MGWATAATADGFSGTGLAVLLPRIGTFASRVPRSALFHLHCASGFAYTKPGCRMLVVHGWSAGTSSQRALLAA